MVNTMKKIIDGKLYNTETAKKIATWSNTYGHGDFKYCEETLFKKKTGEYFLYGEGGALSKYARSCGNNSCGGNEFIPLSENEAKEWMEIHADADDYIAEFGEVEE